MGDDGISSLVVEDFVGGLLQGEGFAALLPTTRPFAPFERTNGATADVLVNESRVAIGCGCAI